MKGSPRQTSHARAGSGPVAPTEQADFHEVWRPSNDTGPRGPERLLFRAGLITKLQLEEAIRRQRESPHLNVLQVLVRAGAIDESQAFQAVAAYFKLPFKRVSHSDIDPRVLDLLPLEFIKAKRVLPICMAGEAVMVGLCDPADIFLIEDLKRRLRRPLRLAVTLPGDIHKAVEESGETDAEIDAFLEKALADARRERKRKA